MLNLNLKQHCNDFFFLFLIWRKRLVTPMRPDSSLHSDLLRAPHFEPKGPWPGWPTGQWTRQGDAAPVGAGSGSGPGPPSISNAAAWLLWRKAGIGGAWRAQPQTAWRWVGGGEGCRSARPEACPAPSPSTEARRPSVRGAGEAVPAGAEGRTHLPGSVPLPQGGQERGSWRPTLSACTRKAAF